MRKKSFVREIVLYLGILTGLLLVILVFFLGSSYGILETEIKDSSDAFLQIYANEFNSSITKMDGTLKSITSQKEDLAKIGSNQENARSLAAISLQSHMAEVVMENEMIDAIVVYDDNYGICLDANNDVRHQEKMAIREFTIKALTDEALENGTWCFVEIEENVYLFKPVKFNNRIIALYIRNDHLLTTLEADENAGRSIVLVDAKGNTGKVWGAENEEIYEGMKLQNVDAEGYYKISRDVTDDRMELYCFTNKHLTLKQTHTSTIVVLLAVCGTFFFMLFILRFTKKEISVPMKQMVHDMERIKDGEYDGRVEGEFHTEEFRVLQMTTNQMVDEIVGLKIRSYEKKIELQDMELKSIRLQLKPHFFLNALTTISSLSSQGKNPQIKTYIEALSRNVRYMFRAGFHTVPLKEEIRHVENYFEMQELKYPGCVFYLIDMPPEAENWKVPQMLIHTFIENEYKYAVSIDEILTLLIKISIQQYVGEEMLLIEIEDDGMGYPKEVLDYMSGDTERGSDTGTRVGLWSIKRMLELMYERKDLLVLKNAVPHGCLNRIYIPKDAVHELSEEQIQNRI